MKEEKNFVKKKIKNFQKYKTTAQGYYSYLAEKKLDFLYNLNHLKLFIDQSGKIKSRVKTGLTKSLQKKTAVMLKKSRALGFLPFIGISAKAFKSQKAFKA